MMTNKAQDHPTKHKIIYYILLYVFRNCLYHVKCFESHDLVSDIDVYCQMWCYSHGTVKSAWPAGRLVRSGSQSVWWVCS